MPRRLLPALLLLLAVLALPGMAGAAVRHIAPPAQPDSSPLSAKAALRKATAVSHGRGVERGFELTPLLKQVALKLPQLSGRDRWRATKLLARPTASGGSPGEPPYSVPEHSPPYCTAHFCVHWVTATQDAPPLADSDHDGVPNYVETTASVFEHVHQVENDQLGWIEPKSD